MMEVCKSNEVNIKNCNSSLIICDTNIFPIIRKHLFIFVT